MIRRARASETDDELGSRINMTPMIDMVFILLIFFMVTSRFTRDAGVEVSRPRASTATPTPHASIMIAIDARDRVWVDGRSIDVRAVRARVETMRAEHPQGSVIIVADEAASTGRTVAVLDQARLAGAANVAIAASNPEAS